MQEKKKQEVLLNRLLELFRKNESVHAVILGGSLAEYPDIVDEWSDIDLKLVIDEGQENQFVDMSSWISEIGQLVGVEIFQHSDSTTLRICLEDYQRIDLVLIPNCGLVELSVGQIILWQRDNLKVVQKEKTTSISSDSFTLDVEFVRKKINDLWFQASVVIGKVVRHDYLIAYHLTLMVMQGILELQMMRRDAALHTNIHREAGWGNDIVEQFPQVDLTKSSSQGILQLIELVCEILDDIAAMMLDDYSPRLPLLQPAIHNAMGEE